MVFDFKKEYKELYKPKDKPSIINVEKTLKLGEVSVF